MGRVKPDILWADPPEEPTLPRIPILSPRPGTPTMAFITSERLTGVVTHYINGRTKPCTGVSSSCAGCISGKPKRWKGYLAGVVPPSGKMCIVEVTYEAYRSCKELHGVGAKIQGKKITLERMGKSPNSRVRCTIQEPLQAQSLGPPFDLEEALCRVWFGERPKNQRSDEQRFSDVVNKLTHQIGLEGDNDT